MPATECSPLQEGRIATVRWGSKSFVQLLSYAYTLHCGSQGPLEWPVSCRIRIANHLGKPNPRYQRAPTRSIPGLTSKNTPLVFLEELKAFQGVSRWTLNITSDGTPILSIEELASAFLPPNLQALADLRQVL